MTDPTGIPSRNLGTNAPVSVSALGLGCMGMSEFYGSPDEAGRIATIQRALDLGVTFVDTADMYGAAGRGQGCPLRRSVVQRQLRTPVAPVMPVSSAASPTPILDA